MKTKILTVVGARPQFIKAAVISRLIEGEYNEHFEEVLVHTGQHYDNNISAIFFEKLKIKKIVLKLNDRDIRIYKEINSLKKIIKEK